LASRKSAPARGQSPGRTKNIPPQASAPSTAKAPRSRFLLPERSATTPSSGASRATSTSEAVVTRPCTSAALQPGRSTHATRAKKIGKTAVTITVIIPELAQS
jgi:hypothetical protein